MRIEKIDKPAFLSDRNFISRKTNRIKSIRYKPLGDAISKTIPVRVANNLIVWFSEQAKMVNYAKSFLKKVYRSTELIKHLLLIKPWEEKNDQSVGAWALRKL